MIPAFPTDDVMREMAKLCVEIAVDRYAKMAEELAADPVVADLSGRQSLLRLAAAIRNTNSKMFPPGKAQS